MKIKLFTFKNQNRKVFLLNGFARGYCIEDDCFFVYLQTDRYISSNNFIRIGKLQYLIHPSYTNELTYLEYIIFK
jgi:hypothetical protein